MPNNYPHKYRPGRVKTFRMPPECMSLERNQCLPVQAGDGSGLPVLTDNAGRPICRKSRHGLRPGQFAVMLR